MDSDSRKTALARTSSIYKRQTRPPFREGAHKKKNKTSNKDLAASLRWVLYAKTEIRADGGP
jgi:hypothetical protein